MATTTQESGTLVPGEAFARTYACRVYDDPWQAVQDYVAVVEFEVAYPEAGASAIATLADLPVGRVRPWLDGSRPNCVRGLEAAEAHGWVDVDPTSDTLRGLNALVAWVFSGGSIATDTWTPYFRVEGGGDRELLDAAAGLAGVELDFTRAATDARAQEMRPVEHGSVLGRVLSVLGAPRGHKTKATGLELPAYLDQVPRPVAREFVQVVLHNRARTRGEETIVPAGDGHPAAYLEALARLVRQLTDKPVSVTAEGLKLSAAATREVAVWDPLLGID